VILDIGCGPGVALRSYASQRSVKAHGIDYAQNMVAFAQAKNRELTPHLKIDVGQADVQQLPYADASFDMVTSSRCLMALLDWERQKKALVEVHRILKRGGQLILMEGTFDGLERLNAYRRKFGLAEIEADGRDRLLTLKFREKELLDFCAPLYEHIETKRFGMYYFLTRIVQPLLVAPEPPRYDHKSKSAMGPSPEIESKIVNPGPLSSSPDDPADPDNRPSDVASARGTICLSFDTDHMNAGQMAEFLAANPLPGRGTFFCTQAYDCLADTIMS
jgi:ubiquinone/menaquinone biosynthesis C-methylase UbiE